MTKQPELFKGRDVNMDMDDIAEFVAMLRKEWPTICFVERDYGDRLIDRKATREKLKKPENRHLGESIPFVTMPREKWFLDIYDAPDDPGERLYQAWVLPDLNWEPEWGVTTGSVGPGYPIVVNEPRNTFFFYRGCYMSSRVQRTADTPPVIQDDTEWVDFGGGWIWGSYKRDDAYQCAFLTKLFRLIGKMTSNKHVQVSRDTGAITTRIEKGGSDWSARHLRAWARSHPRHFIEENLKPLSDKIDEDMY